MCCHSAVIQYVQYLVSCMRINREWSPTHRTDNIFYAPPPNKRSHTHTEYQTENRTKIKPATHERQRRECSRLRFTQLLERRTWRMERPGAYSHWRYNTVDSGPAAVCSFTSTAAASSPPPRLATDHCSTPSPCRELTGWWCLFWR